MTGKCIHSVPVRDKIHDKREKMRDVFKDHTDLSHWIDYFLSPRSFEIKVDGRTIGRARMTPLKALH